MTAEELNSAFRDHVRSRMPRHVEFSRRLLLDDDPEQLSRFMLEQGSMLTEHGLLEEWQSIRVNKVFLAMYKNTALEQYLFEFSDVLSRDTRASETIRELNLRPELVAEDDFRYVFDNYLAANVYVEPMVDILLQDSDFRAAMDLGDDITLTEFKRRSAAISSKVTSYEEFQQKAQQYSYFGPLACGWTVCVLVLVVAVAVAITNVCTCGTPVTCASGATCLPKLTDMLPTQSAALESECLNHSSKNVWLVVKGHFGFRRAALAPGESSKDLGLQRVEAILIGGGDNEVASGTIGGRRVGHGCYVLACNSDDPGAVSIEDDGDGQISIHANPAQARAEASGTAGYSTLDAEMKADFADARFATDSAAVLLPSATDRDRLFRLLGGVQRHDRSVRMSNWLKTMKALAPLVPEAHSAI
jgi:hypothetical protein